MRMKHFDLYFMKISILALAWAQSKSHSKSQSQIVGQ